MSTPYEPAIGDDDFEGIVCDLDDEVEEKPGDEKPPKDREMARFVIKALLFSSLIAIAVTGGYGLVTSDWTPVSKVWAVTAAPLGMMCAKYLGGLQGNAFWLVR